MRTTIQSFIKNFQLKYIEVKNKIAQKTLKYSRNYIWIMLSKDVHTGWEEIQA